MLSIRVKPRAVLKWIFVLVVIAFGVQTVDLIHSRMSAHGVRKGGPIPYTVVLKETVLNPDGVARVGAEITRAVRSDGSLISRGAIELGDGTKNKQRFIQFASGIEVSTNDLANTKSTTLMAHANSARWQRDPNSKCINSFAGEPFVGEPKEVISGEETILGYRTVKITNNNATWWFALDYGCAMVKSRMDWGGQGVSGKNLVALIPGEPEAALFDVAQFREAPFSEMLLGPGKKLEDLGPREAESLRKMDEDYYKRRLKQ